MPFKVGLKDVIVPCKLLELVKMQLALAVTQVGNLYDSLGSRQGSISQG